MIRSVAPGDLWTLRRKPRNQVVLYNTARLVQPQQPLWFALRCIVEGSGQDRAMAVFSERGVRGFVQVKGRRSRPEQDIIALATYGHHKSNLPSDYDIWFRLLERLIVAAGHHGVQRLYGSIWDQHLELREVFRQLGFQAYMKRVILQLSGPDWDQGTSLAPMRAQSRQDSWAIHKLYGSITPRAVQYSEVYTPRAWLLASGHGWNQTRQRAWVLGPADNLMAYLHVTSGPLAHALRVLVHPDARDTITSVLRFGLAQLNDNRNIYLLINEHQQELLTPAQSLGFQPIGDQTMMMKTTIVPVRKSLLVPKFEPGLERQVPIPGIFAHREEAHSDVRTTPRSK